MNEESIDVQYKFWNGLDRGRKGRQSQGCWQGSPPKWRTTAGSTWSCSSQVHTTRSTVTKERDVVLLVLLRLALSRRLSCRAYPLAMGNTPSIARLLRGSQLYSGDSLGTCLHPHTTPNVRPSSHGRQMLSPKNGLVLATCGHIRLVAS